MGAVVAARPSWQEASIRPLSAAYFAEGIFAQAKKGELFQHFTCLPCGHRSVTWVGFRLHRHSCVVELAEIPEIPVIEP